MQSRGGQPAWPAPPDPSSGTNQTDTEPPSVGTWAFIKKLDVTIVVATGRLKEIASGPAVDAIAVALSWPIVVWSVSRSVRRYNAATAPTTNE